MNNDLSDEDREVFIKIRTLCEDQFETDEAATLAFSILNILDS